MPTKITWTAATFLLLGVAASGPVQASSYLSLNTEDYVAIQGPTGSVVSRRLGVSYDSRIGLSVSDNYPDAGAASYSPHSAALGLTSAAQNGSLSGLLGSGSTTVTSASLADGKIHAYAAGSASYAPFNGLAVVNTSMVDLLHFSVLGGGSATITFTEHVDGLISTDGTIYSSVGWSDQIAIGDSAFNYRGGVLNSGPGETGYGTYLDGANADTRLGWDSFLSSNLSAEGHDFTGTFTVHDGDMRSFYHRFFVQCAGAVCDFGNTAAIGLVLPENVRLSSDSGVFLTDQGGVPEPASWALLITGFGMAGAALRRRARIAAA